MLSAAFTATAKSKPRMPRAGAHMTTGAATSSSWQDLSAIAICTLAWGTTWYAITLQFGVVDPVISIIYRFALAAALLFAWCAIRGEAMQLTRAQHLAAFGMGVCNFAINYALVYWAEERVTSAVVAVTFAAMAFVNLITFRVVYRERAPLLSWIAALLGVAGVALMSWEEVAGANANTRALLGILLTIAAVIAASLGNAFARRGDLAGAAVAPFTAWGMAYGVALLTLFALLTGKTWAFDFSLTYMLSLAHLAIVGSVVAFLLYFGLARRRGYATASYISALTPLVAMVVSSIFEAKTWGVGAFGGIGLVVVGQYLLLRAKAH
jgi:drug/metabolite transporter (DMT)-like permease